MSFLGMPEEVIWEMSLDLDHDYYEPSSSYRGSGRRSTVVTCKRCGCTGLKWNQNSKGKWDLVYGTSHQEKLVGKLHACG